MSAAFSKPCQKKRRWQRSLTRWLPEPSRRRKLKANILAAKRSFPLSATGLAWPGQPIPVKDRKAQGAGELMTEVRNTYADMLTTEKLFAWHTMLLRESRRIIIGAWRTHEDPMQTVSGAVGKESIHFEAPPSSQVPEETDRFVMRFNNAAPGKKRDEKSAGTLGDCASLL